MAAARRLTSGAGLAPLLLLVSGCSGLEARMALPARMAFARLAYSGDQVEECERLRDALLTGCDGDVVRAFERAVKEVAPERIVEVSVTEWPWPDPDGCRTGRPLFGFSRAGAGGGSTSWDGATEVGDGTTGARASVVRSDGSTEPCEWSSSLAVLDPEQARAIAEGPLAPIVADVGPHVVTLERVPDGVEVFSYEHRGEPVNGRSFTVEIVLRELPPPRERRVAVRP